jgi:hypothetical protein
MIMACHHGTQIGCWTTKSIGDRHFAIFVSGTMRLATRFVGRRTRNAYHFHKDCCLDWLMKSTKCPECRREYVPNDCSKI